MATYLDRILEQHRADASNDTRRTADLIEQCVGMAPTRGFRDALGGSSLSVIAEVKRRSPSKGDLCPDLNPASLARTYEAAGASCLSVLTDEQFFGGSVSDLQAARDACALPVIRKDFTVSANDVVDARLMGADCVLLIAAALSPAELAEYHDIAMHVGLDALVEIHDEAELVAALDAGASLIGVNQRDLVTFQVDHDRAVRVGAAIPDGVTKVGESGVRDRRDAERLRIAGYDAILVGETLVTSNDTSTTLTSLIV